MSSSSLYPNKFRFDNNCLLPASKNFLLSITVYLFSLSYATGLALLPIDVFKDRINYLNYAENSYAIFQSYFSKGMLAVFSNEPIWLLINTQLANFFEPEIIIRLLIFIPAFLVAHSILSNNKKELWWCLLFLLLPQVIKNHIVHLRQGVAIAVFLTGWYANKHYIKWFMLGLTPFIHASFAFVLTIYFLTIMMKKIRLAADLRSIGHIGAAIAISLILGWLANIVGARQGQEYEFTYANISGLGFLFWLWCLFIVILQGKCFLKRFAFETGGLLFYLVSYWFIPVTARIFESMLLLILVAGLHLTGWRKITFLASITLFCIIQYILRIHQPWFGFA